MPRPRTYDDRTGRVFPDHLITKIATRHRQHGALNFVRQPAFAKFSMGAVHGVHMKYVAMSIGCVQTARSIDSEARFIAWSAFWYCAILHALIAACFVLRVGMPLIGKSAKTGQVPWWSYVIFWGFHLPTWLYTELHTRHSVSTGTPVATEERHA